MTSKQIETSLQNQTGILSNLALYVGLSLVVMAGGCNLAANNHNVQGRRLFEQGQYQQAVASFQRSLSSNPQNADAYYNMGSVYHHLGRQQKNSQWVQHAQQLYSQAIGLNPNHVSGVSGNGRSIG